MRGIIRWLTVLAAVIVLISSQTAGNQVWAGDGNGDGSGGGQKNPLAIESSLPVDGATGVTGLEYIKIVFNKNVAYMTIRDKNMQCISLWFNEQRIPAEVIIADDQIEREKRNDILVKPKQPLQAGNTYRVEIAPELQSKSGVTLGKKATISFTMAGGGKESTVVTPEKDKQSVAPDTPTSDQTNTGQTTPNDGAIPSTTRIGTGIQATDGNETGTIAPATVSIEQDTANPASDSNSNNLLWIALGAAVVVMGAFYYRRTSRSK